MLRSTTRLAPLALAFALVACQDTDVTAPEEGGTRFGTGKGFTLLLTDAPGDLEAAVVTISEVSLVGSGGSEVDLLDEPFTGDLLELRNEVATLVSGFDVPAGSYTQLRLVLDGAYIEVETESGTKIYASSPDYAGLEGEEADGTLQMPSMAQSGLKINLPGGRLEIGEGETIVMLDFDASKSFGHEAGKSGRWVMHPVIKATNVTFGGNVMARLQLGTGITLPMLGGTQLTLGSFQASLTPVGGGTPTLVTLSDTNGDGIFEALYKGLAPGQYTLSFVGPTGLVTTFSPVLPLTVTVSERQTTTQTVTLASAALTGTVTATLKLGTNVTLPSIGSPPAPVTLAQFKAQLTPSGGTAVEVTFTDANNDGTFEASFPNLAPGAYALTLVKPAGITPTYDVTLPIAITLGSGATETRPIVITAVTAP